MLECRGSKSHDYCPTIAITLATFYVLFQCFLWKILARCHFTYNGTLLAIKNVIFHNHLLQTILNKGKHFAEFRPTYLSV